MKQNCLFIGRTTGKPKLNFTTQGKAVTNFSLAVNRKNNKSKADFIPCVIWGEEAKDFTNKFGKGTLIYIEGEFRTTLIPKEDGKNYNELQFEVSYYKNLETPKPVVINESESQSREEVSS